jgi:hypothetical protein
MNQEEAEGILNKKIKRKAYPSNPLDVIREFKHLKKEQVIRLLISVLIITLFAIFNNIRIIGNPTPDNNCYKDNVLDFFKPLNNYYRGNDVYRIILTILGSFLIDIVFFVGYFLWGVYAVDWRYGVNTMLFYGPRAVMQLIIRLDLPDFLYFKYPHFPSVVVGYIQGSDFFWSGHCGFPIIGTVEFIWLKRYKLAAYCAFVSFFEVFLMINSREHYTIDIIIGIIFAHYITLQGRDWVKAIYDKISFLNKLKLENRKELKRIGADFDNGD